MTIVKQLLKEFAVPMAIAIGWTAYNLYDTALKDLTVRSAVNIFGPTFFFASWLMAQWFRVKKQQGVDKGLVSIEKSVNATLAKLESTASHLAGHITGGDSFCYFFGPRTNDDFWPGALVIHSGEHPLYDVTARIFDVDAAVKRSAEGKEFLHHDAEELVTLGNIIPKHACIRPIGISLGPSEFRRFNVFFSARNGSLTQRLRFRRVDDKWAVATRVTRGDDVVYENIDEGYLLGGIEVDWDA